MIKTKRFRNEHKELLDIATKISENLNIYVLSNNALTIKKLISDLGSNLNVHLSIEDKAVYPKLLEHSSEHIKITAQNYIQEMGHISEEVKRYKRKWDIASKIQKNPDEFIRETNEILNTLIKRIDKEDNGLYDLIDDWETSNS